MIFVPSRARPPGDQAAGVRLFLPVLFRLLLGLDGVVLGLQLTGDPVDLVLDLLGVQPPVQVLLVLRGLVLLFTGILRHVLDSLFPCWSDKTNITRVPAACQPRDRGFTRMGEGGTNRCGQVPGTSPGRTP